MAREVLLLLVFFLLSALSHEDAASLPLDCLDFDLNDLEDYLSSLNLTEVPSVETMVAGFRCPVNALPFGSLKSDWSRLLLLYEAADVEFKEKLKRLFRILVIVFHRFQERLVPTKGVVDSRTLAGQFSTVSYSTATARQEVMKYSANLAEDDESTTHANSKSHESNIQDSVTFSNEGNPDADDVRSTEFYSNFNNESIESHGKLSTRSIAVEDNQKTISDGMSSGFFTATQGNPVNTIDEQFPHSVTEESPASSGIFPSKSSETPMKNPAEDTGRIPEDVSDVTKESVGNDGEGNREGNNWETKHDNATSGADTVSLSTEAGAVSNSVSASGANARGDGADFYYGDNTNTKVTYSNTDDDLTSSPQSFSTYATDSYAAGNLSSGITTELMTNENETKMNEKDDDEGKRFVTEISVYETDSTRLTNSSKEEESSERESVENRTTTVAFQDVDQSKHSSGNPSLDVIKTTDSSGTENDATRLREMNNSISTSAVISTVPPGELKGQQTSGEKAKGSEESTFKSDEIMPAERTTVSGQEEASSFKYTILNFPDPSLNSVYKIIRHEQDPLNPIAIEPEDNGSYQPKEHKIKKPQIVRRPPPENPFFKFAEVSTTPRRGISRRPEASAERISLMGSKKRQSFDNDVENQYRWFYKLAEQGTAKKDGEARDNAEIRCKHGG